MRILRKSTQRRGAVVAEWACGSEYEPYLTQDWLLEERAELHAESCGGVSLSDWAALARVFVRRAGHDKVRYRDS